MVIISTVRTRGDEFDFDNSLISATLYKKKNTYNIQIVFLDNSKFVITYVLLLIFNRLHRQLYSTL